VAGAENTMDASNEVVVVFGGSSGIGEAVARTMAARGSRVVIVGRDPGRLAAAAGRLGGAVRTAVVDASDRDAVDAFFADLPADADHLVLSFSTGRAGGPFRDLLIADLAAAIHGKLIAYLSVLQAALPRLRSDGSVTLVGAGSAESALPATAGLAAVNGGLHAAVRRVRLGRRGGWG
jgi:NADP-dependent 3-hydroxy acid dehydrogenase YdfG